jgi:hypothetical protein
MKKWAALAISILVGALVVVAVGNYLLQRSLRRTDFGPLSDLLQARLGEALTVNLSSGDINHDRHLFQTLENATIVVNAAATAQQTGTSEDIRVLPHDKRVDGWGNWFCITKSDGEVAAISSGGASPAHPNCGALFAQVPSIRSLTQGRLYRTPFGALILVGPVQHATPPSS